MRRGALARRGTCSSWARAPPPARRSRRWPSSARPRVTFAVRAAARPETVAQARARGTGRPGVRAGRRARGAAGTRRWSCPRCRPAPRPAGILGDGADLSGRVLLDVVYAGWPTPLARAFAQPGGRGRAGLRDAAAPGRAAGGADDRAAPRRWRRCAPPALAAMGDAVSADRPGRRRTAVAGAGPGAGRCGRRAGGRGPARRRALPPPGRARPRAAAGTGPASRSPTGAGVGLADVALRRRGRLGRAARRTSISAWWAWRWPGSTWTCTACPTCWCCRRCRPSSRCWPCASASPGGLGAAGAGGGRRGGAVRRVLPAHGLSPGGGGLGFGDVKLAVVLGMAAGLGRLGAGRWSR